LRDGERGGVYSKAMEWSEVCTREGRGESELGKAFGATRVPALTLDAVYRYCFCLGHSDPRRHPGPRVDPEEHWRGPAHRMAHRSVRVSPCALAAHFSLTQALCVLASNKPPLVCWLLCVSARPRCAARAASHRPSSRIWVSMHSSRIVLSALPRVPAPVFLPEVSRASSHLCSSRFPSNIASPPHCALCSPTRRSMSWPPPSRLRSAETNGGYLHYRCSTHASFSPALCVPTQFVWSSPAEASSRGTAADMFTHLLDHHYCLQRVGWEPLPRRLGVGGVGGERELRGLAVAVAALFPTP